MAFAPQLFSQRRAIGNESPDDLPEALRMIHFDEMRDFVGHHVVDEVGWHLYETPIEVYAAAAVAASPSGASARKHDFGHAIDAEQLPVVRDALFEAKQRLVVQPAMHRA